MARAVALSTLRSDVRAKGDFGGAQIRHTDAQINRLINQSIQMFRERISDEGSTHYLVSATGSLGVGATSPYPFYQLDLSALSPALVRTYGIDVTFPGGEVCTLERVPFDQRAKYGSTTERGRPMAWAHFRTDQVAIMPGPDSAYTYVVWYLPKFTDLSADGDTFDGVAGWEEWVVWDVVSQCIARDQFPQAFEIAERRRMEVEQRVMRGATKVSQAGGAHIGRDSFGSKLPHFLGGSRPKQTAAGGPIVPANGSVTNAMLADMTGPTVKGRPSGVGAPIDWAVPTLTSALTQFNTLRQGVVPLSDGLLSSFLRADGQWAAPGGGGGGGNSVGPSGAVQFQAGTGFAGASGFRILGNSPSLIARIEGSLRLTGGQIEVGSGTTKIQATGIDAGGGGIVNVATLVGQDASFRGLLVSSGIPNSQLSPMASGTVKGQLGANATPNDIPIPTLLGLVPTFTSTQQGTVPPSGGGTANFLRADGQWTTPPSGGGSPAGDEGFVQYRDELGGFQGASGVRIVASGAALMIGASGANSGNLRVGQAFQMVGRNQSGVSVNIVQNSSNGGSGSVVFGSTALRLNLQRAEELFRWELAGASGSSVILSQTGADFSQFHVAAKSVTVSSGIPNAQLSPMASGTVKAQLGADATPTDVPIQSLTAALYHFDTVTRGVVPLSPGGTTTFLRADGAWSTPAGGTTAPSGPAFSLQFNNGGGFDGATGIRVVASGQALQFGASGSLGALGYFNPAGRLSVNPTGTDLVGPLSAPTAVANFRAITVATGIGNQFLDPMGSGMVKARLSGTGAPQDVPIATLLAFAPTFTSTRAGIVPESGGGTTNFLSAAGTWIAPSGAHQFPPAAGATNAQLAVMPTGTIKGNLSGNATPSDVPFATFMAFAPTFTAARMGVVPASGGGSTNFLRADGAWATPGASSAAGGSGAIQFNDGAGGLAAASGFSVVSGSGIDASTLHIRAKSIDTPFLNGLPTDFAALKRFSADLITNVATGVPSGLSLYPPRGAASGGNRFIIPSGGVPAARTITLRPTGGRAGEVLRIERNGTEAFAVSIALPTGTVIHVMPSGTKSYADFMFTKPSGVNFELAGHADLF